MARRAFIQGIVHRAGKAALRNAAAVLVLVLVLSGCGHGAQVFVVKAVAAGVPSLAPFFDEHQGLGHDAAVRSQPVHGGLQQGDTPGLYGGTGKPTVCDVTRLKRFLTDPANHQKAQAWADVLDIATDAIPDYLDRLTPVLLRHDTLVENHDYEKGNAVSFGSLLQAGIAVLVDERGLPAVKCTCGNPLRPYQGDASRVSVTFGSGSRKWPGYDPASLVAVRPAPHRLQRLALVDVDRPGVGIDRPVGTTGRHDSAFDAREQRAVPSLAGAAFAEARRRLAARGLAAGYTGKVPPPDDARVTASDPPAGTPLRFGAYVTLSVAAGATSGGAVAPPGAPRNSGAPDAGTLPPPSSSKGGSRPPSSPASITGGSSPASAGTSSPPGPGSRSAPVPSPGTAPAPASRTPPSSPPSTRQSSAAAPSPASAGTSSPPGPGSRSAPVPSPGTAPAPASRTPSASGSSARSSPPASVSPRSSAPEGSSRPPSRPAPTLVPATGSGPGATSTPPTRTGSPASPTLAPPATSAITSGGPPV